jgi:4a-hydroxytetrahydrobiopterin dehydratase
MWEQQDFFLNRIFVFKNFNEALSFINQIGFLAEQQNHHPTIINTYNKVELKLCTHDANNTITEKDWLLAKSIDKMFEEKFI